MKIYLNGGNICTSTCLSCKIFTRTNPFSSDFTHTQTSSLAWIHQQFSTPSIELRGRLPKSERKKRRKKCLLISSRCGKLIRKTFVAYANVESAIKRYVRRLADLERRQTHDAASNVGNPKHFSMRHKHLKIKRRWKNIESSEKSKRI